MKKTLSCNLKKKGSKQIVSLIEKYTFLVYIKTLLFQNVWTSSVAFYTWYDR